MSGPKGKGPQSHSVLLKEDHVVYELQMHDCKSGEYDNYLKEYEKYISLVKDKVWAAELVGSFQVMVGRQDQAVHLWKYKDGYKGSDAVLQALRVDRDISQCALSFSKLCTKRKNQLLRSFGFWNQPSPRPSSNIYEMRSYVLKPGQMIEWGNHWATGITYRRDFDQDFGGFFTQIGQLYNVYHIWAYKDLQRRNEIREHMWAKPGWDQTVAATVPLINEMDTRVMIPNEFSPTQ